MVELNRRIVFQDKNIDTCIITIMRVRLYDISLLYFLCKAMKKTLCDNIVQFVNNFQVFMGMRQPFQSHNIILF